MYGPFLTSQDAAIYCGYRSAKSFFNLIKDFEIPRYGPNKTKFSQSDLDLFMTDPDYFKPAKTSKPRQQRLQAVTL